MDRPDETRRAIRLAAILTLLIAVTGAVGLWIIKSRGWWSAAMMYEHFMEFETWPIALLAVTAIAVLVLTGRNANDVTPPRWLGDSRRARLGLAAAVLVVVFAGSWAVFRNYAFVDDEYSGTFQAQIYANGQETVAVGAPWCGWIKSLTPTSIGIQGCEWRLGYFPVNALIRAAFIVARVEPLMHPVIAALTVLLVMGFCRRAWPDDPARAALSGLFLATSTQFLLMSMTAFSMTAHLLASAMWLWLWIRPERWAVALLPWVGVLAIGIHSPYPHVLFATPLILRYLFQRRFAALAYIGAVYAAGCIAWITWLRRPTGGTTAAAAAGEITTSAAATVLSIIGDPFANALSTVVLGTWNVPIAMLCVFVALLCWRQLDGTTRWIAFGLLFTLVARSLFFGMYGMGWGHRYAHAVLANFAIVAAAGASILIRAIGSRAGYRLVGASFVVAALALLPLRGFQAHGYVAPYVRASAYIAALPADVVIFQAQSVKWGRQLVRNDPFLRRSPKIMDLNDLTPEQRTAVLSAFPGRVHELRPEELQALGVAPAPRIGRFFINR